MSWIQTFTGRKVFPLALTPDQVDLDDIAQGLAMTARFRGQTREFYSVAQHSVVVSLHVPRSMKMAALLHDAAEAYLFDACRPIKDFIRFSIRPGCQAAVESMHYRELVVLRTIFEALGVRWPTPDEWGTIMDKDNAALMAEARDLLGPPPEPWGHGHALPFPVVPVDWRRARELFMVNFHAARGGA